MNPVFDLTNLRNARWIGLALFIITILSRLPFQSQYLYHWDSVNMAFGILQFDVPNGAPQYPGYIVYIVIAQVTNLLFNDPQRTMVFISVLSSGLAASTIFYLGREMFNQITGIIAALFLAASPLFWFYSEIALPHTFDLFFITLCAWLLYKIMIGQTRWLWWTTILLALLGGFRQQDLIFMAPITILACYRVGVGRIVGALILGALITLAWIIPLMAYSGGIRGYLDGSAAYTASFFTTTSIFSGAGEFGLRRNILNKLIPYTLYGWSLAAVAALFWLPLLPRQFIAWLTNRKFWFLALWLAPAVIFYAIVHMGQQGLVFVFLPALILISARGLYRLFSGRPALLQASTALVVLVGIIVFIFIPTYPLGKNSFKILTYSTLREHDQLISNQISAVRENFKPGDTVLLAASWRFSQYYLPEYTFLRFNVGSKFEVDAGQAKGGDFENQPVNAVDLGLAAAQSWQIVVMDGEMLEFSSNPLQQITLPNGYVLNYLPMKADDRYYTDGTTFGIE
ncbi:MAG: glycosyltransferase family 39 protein [Anaerolineae bacterium]